MVAAAMVNGTVNGDIYASEKLQLGRTARVMGNIHSPRLVVEEGAILEGSCNMLKARETEEEIAAAVEPEPEAMPAYQQSSEDAETATLFSADDDDDESAEVASA